MAGISCASSAFDLRIKQAPSPKCFQ